MPTDHDGQVYSINPRSITGAHSEKLLFMVLIYEKASAAPSHLYLPDLEWIHNNSLINGSDFKDILKTQGKPLLICFIISEGKTNFSTIWC
jgi:hypothetical protein